MLGGKEMMSIVKNARRNNRVGCEKAQLIIG
jgi:hypothetical protein